MLPKWARRILACAAALCVWLVATPARAAAPLCDPRGATAIAPAPQLQEPTTSLDVGAPAVDGDCADLAAVTKGGQTAGDGRAPVPVPAGWPGDAALLPPTAAPFASPCAPGGAARAGLTAPRAGARSRVDRPPRA